VNYSLSGVRKESSTLTQVGFWNGISMSNVCCIVTLNVLQVIGHKNGNGRETKLDIFRLIRPSSRVHKKLNSSTFYRQIYRVREVRIRGRG
jgi:hypothetical protein